MKLSHELSLTLAPDVDLKLVSVPAGEFLMGSDRTIDAKAADPELPQHKLSLPAYFIGRAPVTVTQFYAFIAVTGYQTTAEQIGHGYTISDGTWMKTEGASWQSPHGKKSIVQQKGEHPVTLVSWHDALAFCKWVTEITPHEVGLPSEAEWERAARGTDGRIYPWGNTEPTNKLCNFNLNVKDTTPAGTYSPQGDSPVEAMDMAGNVMEWTRSLWGVDIHSPEFRYPYTERLLERENIQASEEVRRIVRGGGWDDDKEGIRSAYRIPNPPISRNDLLGFRVCCPDSF